MKRVLKYVAILTVLILAAGIAIPHLAADQFGARIQAALESSLGRKVKIGSVHFNLLTGPGFTISDVTVYDDPSLSAEPILYAGALTAIPRILPLFAGRLAFSSVRLDDAHINLGRTASPDQPARWNVEPLIRPAFFQAFPNIIVNSGRINFKIGGVKAVFYILTDKLEVRPPSSRNQPWSIRLEGEPARSDRPAHGFGSFIADGKWTPAKGLADVTVKLERSEISDILTVLNGTDAGLHGVVSGQARLAGPLSALAINGRVNIRGIHGWDQLGISSQDWPIAIAGTWNIPAQLFELGARLAGQPNAPVNAHFRVAEYLGAPHWGGTVTCRAMAMQPLLPLARQMGVPIPDGVQLNGTLDGAISFSRSGLIEGSAFATKTSLAVSDTPPLELTDLHLLIVDGHATLAPAGIRTAPTDDATIEGDYSPREGTLRVTLNSKTMDIGGLHSHASLMNVPLLRDLQSGLWKGQLTYSLETGSPAKWTGAVDIQHANLVFPFLARPVRVASVHADLSANSLVLKRLQAHAGDLVVTGDYRYDTGALRPHKFHFSTPHATGAQLEALLRPTVSRGGLVSRALNTLNMGPPAPVPDWLAQIKADGELDIAALTIDGFAFEHFKSRLLWDGVQCKLTGAQASFSGGSATARIDADLSGNAPVYHVAGNLKSIAWNNGKVDANFAFDTSGMGRDTLANLRSEGSFEAREIDPDYNSIKGCYQFGWNGKSPRIQLNSLQLSDAEDTYIGSGSTAPNGEIVLEVEGNPRKIRLSLR